MYVKIDGTWHQANDERTETICGLDPDNVEAARESGPTPQGARCPICFTTKE
jgi:hypothetical protein